MIPGRPFPHPRVACLVMLLACLVAEPGAANQHESPVSPGEQQVFEKILEARGRARVRHYPEALTQLAEAAALAEGMENKLPLALTLHNIGEVQLLKGDPLDALKAYHRALGVYNELGNDAGIGMVQRRIGTLSRLLSKPAKPAAPSAPQEVSPANPPKPLSAVDQAVERIRQRRRARLRNGPEAVPPGPVRITRSEPGTADEPGQRAYVDSLRKKISADSRYPDYAKRTRREGTVDLVLVVGRNGDLEKVEMAKSSGFIVLDVEALRNVRESAPFDPVPDGSVAEPLTVGLTFSYKLPVAPGPAP